MLGLLAACASGGASVVKEDGKRPSPAAVDDDLLVPESYRAGPTVEAKRAKAVHKDEPDRPATDSELAAVKVLMDRAEKIRGLTFLRPVPVRIQQKSAVLAYVKSKLDHASAEQVRIRLVALGMIKPDEAIEQKAVEQLANDLLGYYDSTGKYLAIAERASYALTYHMNAMQTIEDRSVMLHELVHALQDQHFDLEHEAARQRTTDEQTAFMALVEGDATLAMLDFELRRFGVVMRSLIDDSGFFEQVMTGLPPTIGAAALGPKAVQSPVVFRYRGGALFAARLVVEGGYPSVDAAFRRQPRSTSEILRPELYARRFRPTPLARPPLSALTRAGYSVAFDDVVGELELSTYLSLGGPLGDDIASDWLGDRFVALQRGNEYAALWDIRFTDVTTSRRAEELATQVGRNTGGHLLATAHGHDLLIIRNVPDAVARSAAQEFVQTLNAGRFE